MELYILKSSVCLLILFSFYKLVLEKEDMHTFKRFYLLGSIVVSFLIPWITFSSYIEATTTLSTAFIADTTGVITSEIEPATNYLPIILLTLYLLGVTFFSFRFFRNLRNLIIKIRRNPKLKIRRITNVLLSKEVAPHTFFSYIFLNKQRFEANEIPSEVTLHEQAHAIQKHSLDVMFIELIQIVFWFNPLVYLLKHAIKLNHEFLADRAVLNNGIIPTNYQNILLAFSSNATPQLANSINYSSSRLNELIFGKSFGQVKKRFTVMKTETSKRRALVRSLPILPLVAILVFGFSTREQIQKETTTTLSESNTEKANSEEIQTYNKIAAFWNARFAQPNAERIMPLTELKKLETLYQKMTPVQKAEAEPFPECAPQKETSSNPKINIKTPNLSMQTGDIKINGQELYYSTVNRATTYFDKSGKEVVVNASPAQIAEYNKLASKYNSQEDKNIMIKREEVKRLEYLYNLMTPEQRKKAQPFPSFPPMPPAPKAPNAPDAPKVKKGDKAQNTYVPPPPPKAPKAMGPPPDPATHIAELAKKGATFYLGEKKITSEEAIKVVRDGQGINIKVIDGDSENSIVRLDGC